MLTGRETRLTNSMIKRMLLIIYTVETTNRQEMMNKDDASMILSKAISVINLEKEVYRIRSTEFKPYISIKQSEF